jgi:hypothetical protein
MRTEVAAHLAAADLILLLLSPDYIASDDLHAEMMRALARKAVGVKVVPIFVRPVASAEVAPVEKLEPLPKNRRPVTTWMNRDEAWQDVVRGILRALKLSDEDNVLPSSRPARGSGAEMARSRNQMIVAVAAIASVTTMVWRMANVPLPVLITIIVLAFFGIAGSVIRHLLRAKHIASTAAGAAVGAVAVGATTWAGSVMVAVGIGPLLQSILIAFIAATAGVGIATGGEKLATEVKDLAGPSPPSKHSIQRLTVANPDPMASILQVIAPSVLQDAGSDASDGGDAGDASDEVYASDGGDAGDARKPTSSIRDICKTDEQCAPGQACNSGVCFEADKLLNVPPICFESVCCDLEPNDGAPCKSYRECSSCRCGGGKCLSTYAPVAPKPPSRIF